MRKRISYILKNSNFFSELYFIVGTTFVNILKIFVKQTDDTVLFVSFGGKQFSDSPKAIYEKMKSDKRFKDWNLVWAFIDPDKFQFIKNRVKIDSISYFKLCLKSRIWVTNSGIKRYLNFSAKDNLFVNTWHGVPMKMIGKDEKGVRKSRIFARKWFEFKSADINLCNSDYDLNILSDVFNAPKSSFFKIGLPRNDKIISEKDDVNKIKKIKQKLGIENDQKVILYAPTVRGEQVTKSKDNIFENPLNFQKWSEKFPNVKILFRAHYFVTERTNTDFTNVIDATNYPNIDDLYLVSDMLISDYSSVFFDYSLLERPMFCYAYDLENYQKYQGLYIDAKKELPHFAQTESDLLKLIAIYGFNDKDSLTSNFKIKYMGNYNGDATDKLLDLINKKIN